jgi:hypothetical protein
MLTWGAKGGPAPCHPRTIPAGGAVMPIPRADCRGRGAVRTLTEMRVWEMHVNTISARVFRMGITYPKSRSDNKPYV